MIYELSGTDAADALGYAVAGGGDVNGDGKADFIVGVPFANPEGRINAGQAFVYSGLNGSLIYQIDGAAAGDRLGGSVGLRGDVNGDGRADIIVGAPYADPGGLTDAGSAYLYSGSDGSSLFQKDGLAAGDHFGVSVGLSRDTIDVDGDTLSDFIVGAPGVNGSAGAAYLYSGATGTLIRQIDATLTQSAVRLGGSVGFSVDIGGDANGDGRGEVIVGAPEADPGGLAAAGSVYLYSGATGNLIFQKNGSSGGDRLGGSVGLTEVFDVNGDARADLIAGAPGTNSSAGSVFIYSGSDGVLIYQKSGGTAGDRLGGSVGIQGDVNNDGRADFIAGAPEADVGSNPDAGNVFVYSGISGGLLYQKNGSGAADRLGGSVGIMGDAGDGLGNPDGHAEFIVGAPVADSGLGLAYVYSGASGNLLYQRNGTLGGGNFGYSVSGAGDVDGDGTPDFIIGTPFTDASGLTEAGSASVYSGTDGSLLFQVNGTQAYGRFGYSVAGGGDVNGDGKADFIIGASWVSPGGLSGAGSAFVYSGADGTLLHQKDGAAEYDYFGTSVAGAGDVNNDGYEDFIIGAPYASALGSAFVYSGATGTLLYQKNGAALYDRLGSAVSGAGDIDGDGNDDFLIGAYQADPAGLSDAGSAYIYSGASGSLIYEKSGSVSRDLLGWSVAGAGDVNGDGKADFIVGSPLADPGGINDAGSAYVYSGATGSLLYRKDGHHYSVLLGLSVAGAEDVNGDDKADFTIGAPGGAGFAYLYSGATGAPLDQKVGGFNGDRLGWSVAGAGDLNGDGRAEIIIGAPSANPGGLIAAGSAFVFTFLNTSAPVLEPIANQNVVVGNSIEFNISASDPDSIVFLSVEPMPLPDGASFIDFSNYLVNGRGFFRWVPDLSQTGIYLMRFIASDGEYADTQNVTFTVTAETLSGLYPLYEVRGAQSGDGLGRVSGIGDVNADGGADFILGAPGADPGGRFAAGSAYVYSGITGELLFQMDGTHNSDRLGFTVAGTGDVDADSKADFIIGAFSGRGSAYLYSGATGALLYQKNVEGGVYGSFSVAGAGDVNGDGNADFIIGDPYTSPSGLYFAGSAYIYSGATGDLLYKINGVNGDPSSFSDNLGFSVAGAGDVDSDGIDDFIIGAPGANYRAGSACVYSGATGGLLYQKDGTYSYREFGTSVAGTGDVNNDGIADFIIGEKGTVYLYSGATGALLYQKDGIAFRGLSLIVAGAGDINGDGKADFIIGAPSVNSGGISRAGSIYLYSGATGALLLQKLGTTADNFLGSSVSGAGDVNGDGRVDFIIGAPGADPDGRRDAGSAWVFGFCAAAKGDMNDDGILTASDVMALLNCVFRKTGLCGFCFADVNCDGVLAPADVVLELMAVFASQPFPCPH